MNIEHLTQQLIEQGWSIQDDFLPGQAITALRDEIQTAAQEHRLRQATIGQSQQHIKAIRGDWIGWIDETQISPALQSYLTQLEAVRLQVNQECQLGLFTHELHYASYKPGSFYRRHVDQFVGNKSRQLSILLYLNDDWQSKEGGTLRLYSRDEKTLLTEVLPQAGRFVCFLSDLPHEVLETQRERMSITGWFKTRE